MVSEEQIEYDKIHKLKGWADPIMTIKEDFYGFECEEEYEERDNPMECMLCKENLDEYFQEKNF
jgi:hypothetical protein